MGLTPPRPLHIPLPVSLLDHLQRSRPLPNVSSSSVRSVDSGLGDSTTSVLHQKGIRDSWSENPSSLTFLLTDGSHYQTVPKPSKSKATNAPPPLSQETAKELRENLKKFKWFWGDMNRADCEAKMKKEGKIGNFAIRINANMNLIMTFWYNDGIHHGRIFQQMGIYKFEFNAHYEGTDLLNLLDKYLEAWGDKKLVPFGGQPLPRSQPSPPHKKYQRGQLAPTLSAPQNRTVSVGLEPAHRNIVHPPRSRSIGLTPPRPLHIPPPVSLLDHLQRSRPVPTVSSSSVRSVDSGVGDSTRSVIHQQYNQTTSKSMDIHLPPPLTPKTAEKLQENFMKYKWFWGDMSIVESEAKMKKEGKIGDFAIRINDNMNLVMTLWRHNGSICHWTIIQEMGLYKFSDPNEQYEGKGLVNLLDNYLERCGDEKIAPFGGMLHLKQNEGWTPPDLRTSELQKAFLAFQSRKDRRRHLGSTSVRPSQAENPRKKRERVKKGACPVVVPTSDAREDEFTQSLPLQAIYK